MTRDQRYLVTLKAPFVEKISVIGTFYLIMGQDYKGGGWNYDRNKKFGKWGSNKAFVAQDDWEDVDDWGDEAGFYPEEAYEEENCDF